MNIIFNDQTKRFELCGSDLTCGSSLKVYVQDPDYRYKDWFEARIEYDSNKFTDGYFAICFRDDDTIFKKILTLY